MAKKKYSINWENEEADSFEVNGIKYDSLDDVPDERDRDKLAAMLHASEDDESDLKFDEKEFEELRKSAESPAMEKIVLGIFSGVAALMILVSVISSFLAIQKISKEETAPGRVVEMTMRREYVNEQDRIVNEYYYPVVEFIPIDGRKRTVQLSEGSSTPSYEKGDEITIAYDPEHPLDARIKSTGSAMLMWILPFITGILGLAFAGGVFVVKKVMAV